MSRNPVVQLLFNCTDIVVVVVLLLLCLLLLLLFSTVLLLLLFVVVVVVVVIVRVHSMIDREYTRVKFPIHGNLAHFRARHLWINQQ